MFGDGAGLATGADDGAEGTGVGIVSAGGGATATGADLCRHPVPIAIAVLTSITCGSARSSRQRHATLAHSAAVTIVELLSQFAQPVRSRAQSMGGVLP